MEHHRYEKWIFSNAKPNYTYYELGCRHKRDDCGKKSPNYTGHDGPSMRMLQLEFDVE